MVIHSVIDGRFNKYGQVLKDYKFQEFLQVINKTPMPENGVIYIASEPALELHPIFDELKNRAFGGMPIQLGYCNGNNTKLNCLEYHRDSEVNIFLFDTILLLGLQSDIVDWKYDISKVEAFFIPAGTGIELFATTLHYAPCTAEAEQGFKVAVCLPKGTNGKRPEMVEKSGEDRLLVACNKWLLAHKDSEEAAQGVHISLYGDNIDISNEIW
jgi:hypothetical protein